MDTNTVTVGLTTHAEGEIRNAAGELVERVVETKTEAVEVSIDDLKEAVERRNLTDAQLREIGLDDNIINLIRSES